MYNIIIKDYASLSFNSKTDLLIIKFLVEFNNNEKIQKLINILNDLLNGKEISLILDFNKKSFALNNINNLLLNNLFNITINKLIIITNKQLQTTIFKITQNINLTGKTPNLQFVKNLDEAIKFSKN